MINTNSAQGAVILDAVRDLVAAETATRIRRDARYHPHLHWISISSREGCRLFVRSAAADDLAKAKAALKFALLDVRKAALDVALRGAAVRIEFALPTVEHHGDQIVVTARARIGGGR